jgi:nucleoprotein TPR
LQNRLDETTNQLQQLRAEQQQSPQVHGAESQEYLENLRQELSQAQEEVERLKADASIKALISDSSTEDGSKSVADQVTQQVEAIRAELEARHQERVNHAEITFQNRADSMKAQLSKKLSEGRELFKQAIAAEHEAALDSLRHEHEEEVEQLKTQHQEELEVLRQNEETRFEQFKETWLAEHRTSDDAAESVIKNESQTSQQDWTPTDSQVKELVANNPTIKSILARNIRTKLDQERARIEEEREKLVAEKLDELQKKANKARDDAVQMEAKRHSVKLSMTENRARAAMAKIEVVQKAAEETPQRPVVEVWAIAKDVKPAPVVPPQPQGGAQASATPQARTFGQPTPVPGSLQNQPTVPGTNRPSSLPQTQPRPNSAQGSVQQRPFSNSSPNSAPQDQTLPLPTSNLMTATDSHPVPKLLLASNRNLSGTNAQQPSPFIQSIPDLPAKPPQPQPSNQLNAGAAANRTLTSGIPRGGAQAMGGARGGRGGQAQSQSNQITQLPQIQNQVQPNNARGTGIPRGSAIPGRGRGTQGRGALQQVQTSSVPEAHNQAQQSPGSGRGAMNAAARQFVPQGNKRAREDGQDGSETGNGKRTKSDGS